MVATPVIARGGVRSQLCAPVDGINHNGDPIDDRSVAAPPPPDPQSHGLTLSHHPLSPPDIDTTQSLSLGLHSCEVVWVRRRTGGGSSMEVR